MKGFLIYIINTYAKQFRFPPKGFSVFYRLLEWMGIEDTYFKKKLPSGLLVELNVNDHIQKQLFWHGVYEQNEINVIKAILEPGDNFIDIGSNIGIYALSLANTVAPGGKIFAFEPSPGSFQHLVNHIRNNHLTNIIAINKGVSDKNSRAWLYLSGIENTGSSGLQPGEEYENIRTEIDVVRLDDWMNENNIEKIKAIKIDIEGHEMQALQGMQKTLQKNKPALLIEIINEHLRKHNYKSEEIYQYLFEYGYKPFMLNQKSKLQEIISYTPEGYAIFFFQNEHLHTLSLQNFLQ